jgi:hypothetical protein
VRRHLTYANVVATLALVLAISGAATAAKLYLITSTDQIAPEVLRELRGNTGATGPTGSGPEVSENAPGVVSLRWPQASFAGEATAMTGTTGATGPTAEPAGP